MLAIYKKELKSYFINPVGYVFAGIFLAFCAIACGYTTLLSGSYDTSAYFTFVIFAMVILIPLLTMRLFAEERKMRTEQLLLTAPVTITGMVLGKFFAAFTMFVSCLIVSCVNFIPLYAIAADERGMQSYSTVHIGPLTSSILGSLIGIVLIGAAFIAIGTLISALTENQLAAAIISISVILFFVIVGLFSSLIDVYAIRAVLNWISILGRFGNFSVGVFDYAALLYYVSIAFIFIFLTIRVYEKRRWES